MKKLRSLFVIALALLLCGCAGSNEPASAPEEPIVTEAPDVETVVRLKNDPLPEGYSLLDYAACTNSTKDSQTIIDTGVSPTNDTRFYLDFQCTSGFEVKDTWFFGCFNGYQHLYYEVGYHIGQGNDAHFYTTTGIHYSQMEDSAARTVAWLRPGEYRYPDILNGRTLTEFEEPVQHHLFLFSRQHMDMTMAGAYDVVEDYDLRIYTCRIWQGGEQVRDFVPCVALDTGRIGMYELTEGKVYYSIGNDELIPGTELLPDSSVNALNGRIQGSVEVPTLEGFVFNGYYTGFAGSGEMIIDAEGNVCADVSTENGLSLYAHWTRDEEWFDRY